MTQEATLFSLTQETGIDATVMYCSATGMEIAHLTPGALQSMFDSLPADCDSDDCISEILTRTLATARTSPAWTLIRPDTIAQQFTNDLPSVLTYLLCRAWEPTKRESRLITSLESRNYWVMQKIKTRRDLASQIDSDNRTTLERLGLLLLEIDSKYNLAKLESPVTVASIPSSLSLPAIETLIVAVTQWRDKLNKAREDSLKHKAESDRSFTAGNSTTKQAYMQEFLRQTPPSPTRQAAIKKQSRLASIWDMFEELESEAIAKPAYKSPLMSKPRVPQKWAPHADKQQIATGATIRFGGNKS